MRAIFHLQGGLGDYYYMLGYSKQIIEERKIDDVKVYIDSAYFQSDSYPMEKQSTIVCMEMISKNWYPLPKECMSTQMYYPGGYMSSGPIYEQIKKDFLFYRLPKTKEYMRERLKETDYFFSSIFGYKWQYEWKDEQYYSLQYTPVKIDIPEQDIKVYSNNILIQARGVGKKLDIAFFNRIISYCNTKGIIPYVVGRQGELMIGGSFVDMRGKLSYFQLLYLLEKIKYAIVGSSGMTPHRLFSNLPTIVISPGSLLDISSIYHPAAYTNKDYHFLDCDINQTDNVIGIMKKWGI